LSVEVLEDRTLPSTLTVLNNLDSGDDSLRGVIGRAQSGDQIVFDNSLQGQTITLTSGELALTKSLDIEGLGADQLTVSGNHASRVFDISGGVTVTIVGLTITNGAVGYQTGGGILNNGTLSLNNVNVSGNSAVLGGDGIANDGTLSLNNTLVSSNYGNPNNGSILNNGTATLNNATVSGNSSVGIYNSGTATLNNATVSGNHGSGIVNFSLNYTGMITLNNCTVSGNSDGGIENVAQTVTLNNSTVSGNSAYIYGGGIRNLSTDTNNGTFTLNNSTVSGNSVSDFDFASYGAGIANYGTLTLNNSTVSGNFTSNEDYGSGGGGISNSPGGTASLNNSTLSGNYAGGIVNSGKLQTRNTIIADNTGGPDVWGNLGSLGHNLIGNSSGGSGYADTDLLDVDAKLGPLQDNGGPTKTIALLAGSPALNAGDPDQLGAKDQRGVVRAGGVNIGAYQASASAFVVTATAAVTAGTPFDLTVKAVDAFGQVAVGYTGTVTLATDDPKGTAPADYTFTADDAGSHTFSGGVTLYTDGSRITATDTADDTLTGSLVVTFAEA
jgi:hypothetical protein